MIPFVHGNLQPTWHRLALLGRHLTDRLEMFGLWPTRPQLVEPLENAVQAALRPIEAPRAFRESLRHNLTIAAQRQAGGLVIEYPRPLREGIVLGLSAGLLAAAITVLVLLFRRAD